MTTEDCDNAAIDLMRKDGNPSAWIRYVDGQLRVITTNAAETLPLLELAIKGLTTPKDQTIQ